MMKKNAYYIMRPPSRPQALYDIDEGKEPDDNLGKCDKHATRVSVRCTAMGT